MDKQLRLSNKKILLIEDIMVITNVLVMIVLSILAGTIPDIEDWVRIVLVMVGVVPVVGVIPLALTLEAIVGYYRCPNCDHENFPTAKRIFLAPHVGRTRYLKCDKCGEKSWQKKIIE